MGDMEEARMQISPETPGRVTVLNPFESPNDYCTLQEQIVSSPSVFKSTKSSSTPGKFRWSIDQLALINPVEIDSEDIRRQAVYLSHARIDKETEERRQKAIEEFFTKSLIVPSPWTEHEDKQVSQFNSTKSIDLNNISPIGRQLTLPGKSNAACQTVLSLPVDFNLEKILGEYFRTDEFADQSQENLSSSSLRRKLFLEENGNMSECVTPSLHNPCSSQPLGVLCSIDISPVRCRSPLETSSSVSQMGDRWEVTSLAQTLYRRLYQFYFLTNSRQSYFCSKLYRRLSIRPMFFNYIFGTIYMSNNFERMQLIFNYKKDMMVCYYSL